MADMTLTSNIPLSIPRGKSEQQRNSAIDAVISLSQDIYHSITSNTQIDRQIHACSAPALPVGS